MSGGAAPAATGSSVPTVVLRALVGLGVGGMTFLVTTLAEQPVESTVVLSVFIGGVVLVVQYLIRFEGQIEELRADSVLAQARADERQAAHEKAIDEKLARVSEAAVFHHSVSASPLRVSELRRLAERLTNLTDEAPPLIAGLAQEEITRAIKFVADLDSGEARIMGDDREWLLHLTSHAEREILATSSPEVDGAFWDTELAAEYMDAQAAVVERGVRIRRIFLVSRSQLAENEVARAALAESVRLQTRLGIAVREVDVDGLSTGDLMRIDNYVVFDDCALYQLQPPMKHTTGATVVQTRLSRYAGDIDAARRRFERWWDRE